MSRRLISVAALVAILPAAGCSSEAKTPPAPSPKFRAAIQRAHMAVHISFASQAGIGMPEATVDEAVAAARAVLQEAAAEAHSPLEENAYLVLLNCFAKDRQRYEIARRIIRERLEPKPAMAEMAGLKRGHTQCTDEFSVWTGPDAPPASGANDGACLTEARQTRAVLLNTLR